MAIMRYRAARRVPGGKRLPSEEVLIGDGVENPDGVRWDRWEEMGGAGSEEVAMVWVAKI
jgi:hypothetical protein